MLRKYSLLWSISQSLIQQSQNDHTTEKKLKSLKNPCAAVQFYYKAKVIKL